MPHRWRLFVLVSVALAIGGCDFGGGSDNAATTAPRTGTAQSIHGIGIGAGDTQASRELAESLYRGYGPKSDSAEDWFGHIKQIAVSGSSGKATVRTDLNRGDPRANNDPVTRICRATIGYGASTGVVTNAIGAPIAKCGFTPQP